MLFEAEMLTSSLNYSTAKVKHQHKLLLNLKKDTEFIKNKISQPTNKT